MKIPASKVPAQVWADKARRRADLDEVESMLLSSWDDSKQVYRIGKELWDELRIDEADEVPVDALLRLPYGCIFIERRWVDEYEQLLTDDIADIWGEASCYVTRYYEGCFCWVEGRTLFVDSLTHHCEMRHTDDYGSDVAEVRRGMRMWLDTIELPIDEGTSLERWYSEELNVVRKANESMSYACEITDEELLMTSVSASPHSSRRCAASMSMTRRVRMAAIQDGMWHPMSGAAIGTGTGPARERTPPVSKSSGLRRQS